MVVDTFEWIQMFAKVFLEFGGMEGSQYQLNELRMRGRVEQWSVYIRISSTAFRSGPGGCLVIG
jgi:hypothetical protein